jgi:D-alanyl-D-alanine carboxypeptidase/D-alanyl-D-alanine-endopeptidase (penicillin-binding protein 4)
MMKVPFVLTFLLFFLFNYHVLIAQDNAALLKLKNELKAMSQETLFKYGHIGFSLRAADGKIIHEFNGDKSLIPASNLKLLTTGTALRILGENFRFETKLVYDGVVKNGTLKGNLYIVGGGDPTLGSERIPGNLNYTQLFSFWTEKIKEAGISKIEGSIIPVNSIFEKNSIPDGWIWSDIGNYYGAGVSGLNINENFYKIFFKPGKVGEGTQILRTEPTIPNIQFDNQVKTAAAGSGDNAYIYGGPFSSHRFISGSIPTGVSEFGIKGSIPDPGYLCSYLLYQNLLSNGIPVSQIPKSNNDTIGISEQSLRNIIYVHHSIEIKEIIKYTNFYSINLYAEALLKMVAVKKGLKGDTKSGVKAMVEYWKVNGLQVEGMFLNDGSGLSPQTGIRPSQMTAFLNCMAKDSSYFASLPTAGESGTLSRFCKGTKAEKKIVAKSGTLSKVICYSGYVKSKNGDLNSFSVFINNYNGSNSLVTSRLEKLMVMLTEIN